MIRRLFTRRWLGALLAAAVFCWLAWIAGGWQWSKHVAKVERNARLDAHYAAPPLPLSQVLGPGPLSLAADWTHVHTTGTYAATPPLYVRNRTNATGDAGYEVLSVLHTGDGTDLLVDRGWVAASDAGAAVLPPAPAAPGGVVEVVGWVRPGEEPRGRDLPAGQLASVELPGAAAAAGAPLLGGYLVLDAERTPSGVTPPRPEPLGDPDRSLGPHQAYAYQWWMSMPVGFVLIVFGIRRELRAEDPTWVPKPKKQRIWDEEDE